MSQIKYSLFGYVIYPHLEDGLGTDRNEGWVARSEPERSFTTHHIPPAASTLGSHTVEFQNTGARVNDPLNLGSVGLGLLLILSLLGG